MKKLDEESQQEVEISDLDDLLRKERAMEKQRRETALSDVEVNNNKIAKNSFYQLMNHKGCPR